MKSWSDNSSENNMIIDQGIHADAVFRRNEFLHTSGYQSPTARCVFVDRDKLPSEWPMDDDGHPLTMIGVVLDLDRYVGQKIRVAKCGNEGGCGRCGTLLYTSWDEFDSSSGFSIDSDPTFFFGIADVKEVSTFEDDEGTQIRIGLSTK